MAKQTFNVGGTQVRAEDSTKAAALAKELAGEKATVSGVIPVASLTAPIAKPMTVVSPTAPTVGAGLSANIATQAQQGVDTFTQEQAAATKAAESGYTNSLDTMLASLTSTEGKTGLTDKAYRDTVDPAKAALNKVNQQILADQEAERVQIEELKKNKLGGSAQGIADRIGQIQDKGIQRRAALAITQLAAQGELSLAQETADRAVAAALERQTIKNDTLKFIFEQNKERFTKAEQRQFETAQADRDRKLNMEEYKLKAQFDQQIKQSDPLYRIQLAKAQKEFSLLGEPTEKELEAQKEAQKSATASAAAASDKLTAIDVLSKHPGLNSRVGATPFTRGPQGIGGVIGRAATVIGIPGLLFGDLPDTATGAGQAFSGGVHKLISGLSLQELIEAKSRGATFGALSDSELRVLANSASAIADWEIKDKNGKGTGFWDVDQASFEKELETIKTLTQRALVSSGGSLISEDEDLELDSAFTTSANPASFY